MIRLNDLPDLNPWVLVPLWVELFSVTGRVTRVAADASLDSLREDW